MTCDDIVKSLREECETCSENSVCRNGVNLAGLYCANSDAADLIENQQNHIRALLQANDALRPAWIPVTERLPEDRSDVLVVAYWRERWGVYMGWCAPERAEWSVHIGIGDRNDIAVTHWMPLPEAPKED